MKIWKSDCASHRGVVARSYGSVPYALHPVNKISRMNY